jgi:hypothetical protein
MHQGGFDAANLLAQNGFAGKGGYGFLEYRFFSRFLHREFEFYFHETRRFSVLACFFGLSNKQQIYIA